MERHGHDGSDVLGTRANEHPGAHTFSTRLAQRKSLRPHHQSKEKAGADAVANGRPASSGSSSDSRPAAAHSTRIPRPNTAQKTLSKPRAGLSFTEAFRMAGEEGSPSPAPRYRRKDGDADERRLEKIMGRGPLSLGTKRSPARSQDAGGDDTQSSLGGDSTVSQKDDSESDIDKKLMQFEEDQRRIEEVMGGKNGIFSKAKVGPKVAERGQELHRKSSNNSLDSNSPSRGMRPWGVRGKPKQNWLTRIISSPGNVEPEDWDEADRDPPIPSIEKEPPSADADSSARSTPFAARSPNKSFAWQADADFTAGDLHVSTSPRVRSKASHDDLGSNPRHNNKIDEIRQLEVEAALRFPDESENSAGLGPNDKGLGGRTNTKIDEIRAREIESLSKKALATARLDEIRERNADYRSPSPVLERKASRELLGRTPGRGAGGQGRDQDTTILEEEGEKIPDTPITIFRKSSNGTARPTSSSPGVEQSGKGGPPARVDEAPTHKREDSRDLLRRLARAASASPTPEDRVEAGSKATGVSGPGPTVSSDKNSSRGASTKRADKLVEPPAIRTSDESDFPATMPALRRTPSTDSASTKRSSMAQSDGDPTDRIQGEMMLFAPLEAQSERGSIRAPSPDPDGDEKEDGIDDTPRPHKPDPLAIPTPKVTGAYVETPLTVKAEPSQGDDGFLIVEAQKPLSSVAVASFLRGGSTRGGRSDDTKSDGGRKETRRPTSAASLRRSRSLPRNRSPLFNSAKPPSVRDDLREIQRQHQVDDSTLEDFGELLAAQSHGRTEGAKNPKLEDASSDEEAAKQQLSEHEQDLAALDRMSGHLKTGLLGIQTAKRGIERLEDKVAKAETSHHHAPNVGHPALPCAICAGRPPSAVATYIHLPVPRLYYRQPSFRLSFLGIVVGLLAAWLAAEGTMCRYYCKPVYCGSGQDCRWSPDDPFFGYAIPVKLDQWVTGGQGRALAHQLGEDAGDLLADAWEFVTGDDLAAADTRWMTFEQRRRHRRRLRKRGLVKVRELSQEQQSRVAAWREARVARERAREAREMGYDLDDGLADERMAGDEKISARGWL